MHCTCENKYACLHIIFNIHMVVLIGIEVLKDENAKLKVCDQAAIKSAHIYYLSKPCMMSMT